MKKLRWLFLVIVVLLALTVFCCGYRYYSPPTIQRAYQAKPGTPSDTIAVAFIGDSWAYMHTRHDSVIGGMFEQAVHAPVRFRSHGICGLTSKEIYEHLFSDRGYRPFFRDCRYAVCIVSAGINDTYKKMSIRYYAQSMDGIISFLLENGIRPVVLEIPDYDIRLAYDRQTQVRKLTRRVSMAVNGVGLDCKQDFRTALRQLINERGYGAKVDVIGYRSWNRDYLDDLSRLYLADGLHLNDDGYARLDSAIFLTVLPYLVRTVW